MEAFDALIRQALVTTAVVALPLLAIAALVGTAVAVVQAATQVQEQTLTLLPKIVAVGVAIAIFGSFGMRLLAELFKSALAAIPAIVAGS